MQNDLKFYRLSGRMNFSGPVLGIILATLVAVPLSFVYAYAVRYIPFIYLNFLLSFGYIAIAAVPAVSCDYFRDRSL